MSRYIDMNELFEALKRFWITLNKANWFGHRLCEIQYDGKNIDDEQFFILYLLTKKRGYNNKFEQKILLYNQINFLLC
jgi:hypothetical protein